MSYRIHLNIIPKDFDLKKYANNLDEDKTLYLCAILKNER